MESIVARGIQVLAALGGAYLVALWFVLVVWTFRDIETRSKNVITQVFSTLLVVLFYLPGVLLYMILRPKETLDAAFQRSLEEEYLLQDLEELPLCRSCQHYVEDDYMICPHCQTQLREACVACSRLVDLRWTVCPYCSTEQKRTTEEEIERVTEPAARWVAPAVLRRRMLRQLPTVTSGEPGGREIEGLPAAMGAKSLSNGVGSTTPLAPVRLFDRRKTREAARLNGYRRPTSLTANGSTNGGVALVDRYGRSLEHDEIAVNGNGSPNGHDANGVGPVRVTIASEETGD